MDIKEIKNTVNAINAIRDDGEAAHSMESDLYHEFVNYIKKTGTKNQRAIAKSILETEKIDISPY